MDAASSCRVAAELRKRRTLVRSSSGRATAWSGLTERVARASCSSTEFQRATESRRGERCVRTPLERPVQYPCTCDGGPVASPGTRRGLGRSRCVDAPESDDFFSLSAHLALPPRTAHRTPLAPRPGAAAGRRARAVQLSRRSPQQFNEKPAAATPAGPITPSRSARTTGTRFSLISDVIWCRVIRLLVACAV